MWFTRFQILVCDLQSIWRKLLIVDFKNTDLGEQLYLSIDNVGLSIAKFWLGYKLECPTQNHNIKCTLFKGLSLSKPKLKFVNFDIMIQHPTMLE